MDRGGCTRMDHGAPPLVPTYSLYPLAWLDMYAFVVIVLHGGAGRWCRENEHNAPQYPLGIFRKRLHFLRMPCGGTQLAYVNVGELERAGDDRTAAGSGMTGRRPTTRIACRAMHRADAELNLHPPHTAAGTHNRLAPVPATRWMPVSAPLPAEFAARGLVTAAGSNRARGPAPFGAAVARQPRGSSRHEKGEWTCRRRWMLRTTTS